MWKLKHKQMIMSLNTWDQITKVMDSEQEK